VTTLLVSFYLLGILFFGPAVGDGFGGAASSRTEFLARQVMSSYTESCLIGRRYARQITKQHRPMVLGGMVSRVSVAAAVCLGDRVQNLLICLHPKDGVAAGSEGGHIWSERNGGLRGYAERIGI
jgi:hypothetical protein